MSSISKLLILFPLLLTLTCCANEPENPLSGTANHIFVYFGSIWGNTSELEISEDGKASSMFELAEEDLDNLDAPYGLGKRASVTTTVKDFEEIGKILQPLEQKAIPEEDIDIENGDLSMGFGCENETTDQIMLGVIWIYPNGKERHATYYTGCHNDFSDKLNPALQKFSKRIDARIVEDDWKKSESRFGLEKL